MWGRIGHDADLSSLPIRMKFSFIPAAILALAFCLPGTKAGAQSPATVSAQPAPVGEPLSDRFTVFAGPTPVPVYAARIMAISPKERQMLGPSLFSQTAETAFASFDLTGSAEVTVTCSEPVRSVKILPSSRGIVPVIAGNKITFTVTDPQQLTLDVNDDWVKSLQIFANAPETDVPRPDDPNVIYFGPGRHEIEPITVPSGKTVYLADGAIVYGKPGGKGAIFSLVGDHIALRGRGIIDGSRCPLHTQSILYVMGNDIQVEGVIFRDSSTWNMPVRRSSHVQIRNIKMFGWRGNSDGIDLCNSRDVEVSDCYLRTFDDLIVLKADQGQGEVRNVDVRHCVLWNEFAQALNIGAELREPLTNISFSDCDIIHDKGREHLLRVYNCDSAWVRNVVFENIRIEESQRLISLWIGHDVWSKQPERGHIENVSFQNITAPVSERPEKPIEFVGFDATHAVANVQLQNVTIAGQPVTPADINQNPFVRNVDFQP
jgi:hypothetical protein